MEVVFIQIIILKIFIEDSVKYSKSSEKFISKLFGLNIEWHFVII